MEDGRGPWSRFWRCGEVPAERRAAEAARSGFGALRWTTSQKPSKVTALATIAEGLGQVSWTSSPRVSRDGRWFVGKIWRACLECLASSTTMSVPAHQAAQSPAPPSRPRSPPRPPAALCGLAESGLGVPAHQDRLPPSSEQTELWPGLQQATRVEDPVLQTPSRTVAWPWSDAVQTLGVVGPIHQLRRPQIIRIQYLKNSFPTVSWTRADPAGVEPTPAGHHTGRWDREARSVYQR